MLVALLSTALALPNPQAKCIQNLKITQGALAGTTICCSKGQLIFRSKTPIMVYKRVYDQQFSEHTWMYDYRWSGLEQKSGGIWDGVWELKDPLEVNEEYGIIPARCDFKDCPKVRVCIGHKGKWDFQPCPR